MDIVFSDLLLFHQPTLMDNFLYSLTNILLMNKENCGLKLVDEIILYYDAWSQKHQIKFHEYLSSGSRVVLCG